MRITARQLRQIIKEELSRSMMREADAPDEADAQREAAAKAAVKQLFDVKERYFPGPASKYTGLKELEHIAVTRAKCKDLLKRAGVAVADIAQYVKKYAPGFDARLGVPGNDMGEADMVSKSQ